MNLTDAKRYAELTLAQGHKSDGCTIVKDWNFRHCCVMHDFLRRFRAVPPAQADRLLRECIIESGHPGKAWIYWAGVRLAYHFWYRWQ